MSGIRLIRPKHDEIVGRVENEKNPGALPKPIVGRIYNEKPGTLQHKGLAHPIIGRIYNELNPKRSQWGVPFRHKVGRIYNEETDRPPIR